MSTHDPIAELKREVGAEPARLVDGWNGDDIAALLETDRSRIAELRRGKLDRFSLETLIRYVTRAGKRVELRMTSPPKPWRQMTHPSLHRHLSRYTGTPLGRGVSETDV